jgi:hypothetical protein
LIWNSQGDRLFGDVVEQHGLTHEQATEAITANMDVLWSLFLDEMVQNPERMQPGAIKKIIGTLSPKSACHHSCRQRYLRNHHCCAYMPGVADQSEQSCAKEDAAAAQATHPWLCGDWTNQVSPYRIFTCWFGIPHAKVVPLSYMEIISKTRV